VPWDQKQEVAVKAADSDVDMVMLDHEASPAPADKRMRLQPNRRGGGGDGNLLKDAGGTDASGDPEPPDAADALPKRDGPSPPRQAAGKEAKVSCKAPLAAPHAAALRRQQQQQDQQGAKGMQQPKPQQQHTAGAAPAQPSHSLSRSPSPGPSHGPRRKHRRLDELYAAGAAGTVPSAPPEASGSGGAKRQRTQRAADGQPPEQPSKPVSAAGSGPLSEDDGSHLKVANRRSTGSSKGAARRLGGSGAEANVRAACWHQHCDPSGRTQHCDGHKSSFDTERRVGMATKTLSSKVPCADDEPSPTRPLVEYENTPPPQEAGLAAALIPEAGRKPPAPGESPAVVTQVKGCTKHAAGSIPLRNRMLKTSCA